METSRFASPQRAGVRGDGVRSRGPLRRSLVSLSRHVGRSVCGENGFESRVMTHTRIDGHGHHWSSRFSSPGAVHLIVNLCIEDEWGVGGKKGRAISGPAYVTHGIVAISGKLGRGH